ncbi:MAG: protoheme IX farnesyltransferase [Bacteroidetes bacterium]|nr:MAG: protoheme IX farnesyltransferase [Bacteroidota bacterium]
MISNKTTEHTALATTGLTGLKEKASSYFQLLKFRLSLLVALSATFGYAMAGGSSWLHLLLMGVGGLLITGASNALNQLFEKETDKLMKRTAARPMPSERLRTGEALGFALLVAAAGIALIGYVFNLPAALLGIIGLLMYAFVYTPMKQVSPFAVFVGAIPGALPPLIGWVAFTGQLDPGGWLLFAFQFFWQFPHFWAIAWVLDEDYKRAGFRLLPSHTGKSRFSALLILIYTACLVPLALFPYKAGLVALPGLLALMLLGLLFTIPAMQLYLRRQDAMAKRLMFASFLYLPAIQLAFLLG